MVRRFVVTSVFFALVSAQVWAFPVDVAYSPASNLSISLTAIQSAQQSLWINIYDLSSTDMVNAVVAKVQQGVEVRVLEEGSPVGGMSKNAKSALGLIAQAMKSSSGTHQLLLMKKTSSSVKRRFKYDHAKYMVVDGTSALIGSDNYATAGSSSSGGKGARGWEVMVHNQDVASYYAQIFTSDSDPSAGDIEDVLASGDYDSNPAPVDGDDDSIALQPTTPFQQLDASAASPIVSPTTSETGLVNLIGVAQSTIEVEQMSFAQLWDKGSKNSPLLDALVAAAQRGVQVRVLLNDETAFTHGSTKDKPVNQPTVDALNQAASSGGVKIEARIANLKAMGVAYIHNKGVLVDSDKTLVSSINWTQNSVENNRETAILLYSPNIHDYYEALFNSDWQDSDSSDGSLSARLFSFFQL
jgi:cardiolipin synthase